MDATPPARRGRLHVVGTGIRAVSQVTPESLAVLQRAELVIYSVADAVTEGWLQSVNPQHRSLATLYQPGRARAAIYDGMVEAVMTAVREDLDVCLALYGHPGVCAQAGHRSIALARREGYPARMLPGVSCEDCLYADLGLDPAADGCQSHEASTFLARRMAFDPRAATVLWQVGMLGCYDFQPSYQPSGLASLADHLSVGYGTGHEVVLYELPSYASLTPIVGRCSLGGLTEAPLTWSTTLFVPPRR